MGMLRIQIMEYGNAKGREGGKTMLCRLWNIHGDTYDPLIHLCQNEEPMRKRFILCGRELGVDAAPSLEVPGSFFWLSYFSSRRHEVGTLKRRAWSRSRSRREREGLCERSVVSQSQTWSALWFFSPKQTKE